MWRCGGGLSSTYGRDYNKLYVVLAMILVVAGSLLILLRVLQTPRGLESHYYPSPTLYSKTITVKMEDGPAGIVEYFKKAITDWDEAVKQFNQLRDLECSIKQITGCRACLSEPRLPQIAVAIHDEYNVLIEFVDSMPRKTLIAYTEPYHNGSVIARIVVWIGIPEHRAYQVAVHEIARLYGVDIPRVYRTLFGVIPAGSDTRKLNPSLEQFISEGPDPMKPTTLDLYTAFEALKNPEGGTFKMGSGVVFRAYDEPDFTIPALLSPFMITAGVYMLSRRWRHTG